MARIRRECCPRCAGPLSSSPADRGALSRADNETIVCAACGVAEAGVGESRPIVPGWRDYRGPRRAVLRLVHSSDRIDSGGRGLTRK